MSKPRVTTDELKDALSYYKRFPAHLLEDTLAWKKQTPDGVVSVQDPHGSLAAHQQQTFMQMQMAMDWEAKRAQELQKAQHQQQYDLARLQAMQNAYTGMSATTTGVSRYDYSTTTPFASLDFGVGASGNSAQSVPLKTYTLQKQFLTEDKARPSSKPSSSSTPLSLKTSPLFGKPAFGRFYNWSFDSPFARIHRWFIRWAWNTRRSIA